MDNYFERIAAIFKKHERIFAIVYVAVAAVLVYFVASIDPAESAKRLSAEGCPSDCQTKLCCEIAAFQNSKEQQSGSNSK